jgi:hypothetical protein
MTATPTVEMYEKAMSCAIRLFDYDEKQMANVIRIANQFTVGMLDILDDLNYNEDVFDELLQNLDSNYDSVCIEQTKLKSFANTEIIDMSETLLVNLAKLQEAISQKMADMKYAN